MKARYRDHRGLSSLKRKAFFNWFFLSETINTAHIFAIAPAMTEYR